MRYLADRQSCRLTPRVELAVRLSMTSQPSPPRRNHRGSASQNTCRPGVATLDRQRRRLAIDGISDEHLCRYTVLIDGKAGAYGVRLPPTCRGCAGHGQDHRRGAGQRDRCPARLGRADGGERRDDAGARARSSALRSRPGSCRGPGRGRDASHRCRSSARPANRSRPDLSLDSGVLAAIDCRCAMRHKLTRSAHGCNCWRRRPCADSKPRSPPARRSGAGGGQSAGAPRRSCRGPRASGCASRRRAARPATR